MLTRPGLTVPSVAFMPLRPEAGRLDPVEDGRPGRSLV